MAKAKFSSKLGLIAATVGSAVGLGNVWRFPAEVQGGGGAAFLIIYILCVLILGIPVMLAEFSLGRAGGTDAIGNFAAVAPKHRRWRAFGALSVLTAFLIAIFYMVVAGWTLEYLWESITGGLYTPQDGMQPGAELFLVKKSFYITDPWRPLIATIVVCAINLVVMLGGVQKGIERLSNFLMPMLFVLLLIFGIFSLTLPGAGEGIEFFFSPDFSKVTPGVVLKALGQAFFSLSLGMGILMTYAAYYPADTRLARTASTVSLLDLVVAVMMGVIIFPALTSFGLQSHGVMGTALVFVTLPEVFMQLPFTALWSSLFFLLLVIAAITSTVSIVEVCVRCLEDRLDFSRRKAVFSLMGIVTVLSIVCSLSMGPLNHLTIAGLNFFDLLDTVTANYMLPIAAIGMCVFVGWVAPRNLLENQLTNNGSFRTHISTLLLYIIRYVAPLLIAAVLVSNL